MSVRPSGRISISRAYCASQAVTSLVGLSGAIGAAGALVAIANVAPEDCVAAFAGDGAAQVRLAALDRTTSLDFPGGYKRATADRFGTSAYTRIGG